MRRRRIRVVAAVIERDGRVLASLRHPRAGRRAQWEFPGGKVEPGESESTALTREIREEMGVDCTPGKLLRRMVHEYPEVEVELAFYRVELGEGEPQPLGMAEIRWVERDRLETLDFLDADRAFVAELTRGAFG